MNIFERFIPAIVGTVIGGPGVGGAVYSATKELDIAKNKGDGKSTNPPLTENTVERRTLVNTQQVSGIKPVSFTQQSGGVSPSIFIYGGIGLIVLLLILKR